MVGAHLCRFRQSGANAAVHGTVVHHGKGTDNNSGIVPELNEEELKEAEFSLRRYIELVLEISERLSNEKQQEDKDQLLS